MLRIGDFSKLSRISIRMLRHYDEIGLLRPETVANWVVNLLYIKSALYGIFYSKKVVKWSEINIKVILFLNDILNVKQYYDMILKNEVFLYIL